MEIPILKPGWLERQITATLEEVKTWPKWMLLEIKKKDKIMDLAENIKINMFAAMRRKDEVEKTVLQVVLGEIQLVQSKSGIAPKKEVIEGIIRKMVSSNREVVAGLERRGEKDSVMVEKLQSEIFILLDYLPIQLSIDTIILRTTDEIKGEIRALKEEENKGRIVGKILKLLRNPDEHIEGRDVEAAIERIKDCHESP